MYKGKLTTIFILLLTIALAFVLFACTSETVDDEGVASISIVESQEAPYVLGEQINLSKITILVTYKNGESKIVPVSDHMLSDSDRELFLQKGTNTIYINYENAKVALQISVIGREDVIEYTARFFSNKGSEVATQVGKVIEAFDVPIRPGYTFDGWYANFNLTGNKVKAPYILNENVSFYAKWLDNRKCKITFLNYYGDTLKEFEIEYGTAIDISKYEAPVEIEGMVFTGWSASDGNTEEVTTDITITPVYMRKDCLVHIYYKDADSAQDPGVFSKKYGDTFNVNEYILPTKAGHVTRWVVYKNEETTYEELPDGGIITVKDEMIVIKPYNVINVYTVTVENGLPETQQNKQDKKEGIVRTLSVLRDDGKDFTVDYDTNFILSNMTEKPKLDTPETVEGYNAVWCLVITTPTGDVWYNGYNQIWNEESKTFVNIEGDEPKVQFDLKDYDGKILATIRGDNSNPGLIKLMSVNNIKGNITIKPKYIKKYYTVSLRRNINNAWITTDTFSVSYLTDFKLYDKGLKKYENLGFTTATDVERSYLFRNNATWLSEVDWSDVYLRSDGSLLDDWAIEWYTGSDLSENNKIDFTEKQGGILGFYEIGSDTILYCKDIDQRRYNVVLYYDYDFTKEPTDTLGNIYKKRQSYLSIKENDIITLPSKYADPIIKKYEYSGKIYNITYTFKGWYDHPYNDPSGYTGYVAQNFESKRTRNVYYYAHYECSTTFNLRIYDKTQKMAYEGIADYEGNHYDVPEDSVFYQLSAGQVFDSATMLYKGQVKLGNITSGQRFYERFSFINWVNVELTDKYNALVASYGTGNYGNAVGELNRRINELTNKLSACEDLWGILYSYNYVDIDKAYYQDNILSDIEYRMMQGQKKIYEDELEVLTSYDNNIAQRDTYSADMSDYKLYKNSIYTLNFAYDYTEEDVNNDNVKYKFLGWYLDENYGTPFTSDMDFEWFVAEGNLNLYAKWADQEKGTEGLVFQKIVIDSTIYLAVVDLVNSAQYTASIYNGSGYNDLENKYYSINMNDQDQVPINIGTNLDIQIPKEHGGDNNGGYKVIGILKGAFQRYGGTTIKSFSMPADIRFIEEQAFYGCNFENLYISGSEYVTAEDAIALYQIADYIVAPSEIDTVGSLQVTGINARANTLLSYASRSTVEHLVLRSGTTRIASYAFSSAGNLKYIDLGSSLEVIGNNAFEGAGALTGHYDTVNEVGTDTFYLPDSLQEIGNYAFKDAPYITKIGYSSSCALHSVGSSAFKSTLWYTSQVGPIIINGNFIGVRGGNDTQFERDENEQIIHYGENLDLARIKSGNNYLYYKRTGNSYILYTIEINDSIKTITTGAFIDSATVSNIIFNDCSDMVRIDNKAFENYTSFANLYLYQATSALVLASEAVFFNCITLENVYVPDTSALHPSFDYYSEYLVNIL